MSDDGRWLAEDGWIWHPVGETVAWDARLWLAVNPYESEDGPSRVRLGWRDGRWGARACFVGGDPVDLVVEGIGNAADDEDLLPGVTIWRLPEGSGLRHVVGPAGHLFAVGRRLCSSGPSGVEVWDVDDGARIARVPEIHPTVQHPSTGELVEWAPDGRFTRLRLSEEPLRPSADGGLGSSNP